MYIKILRREDLKTKILEYIQVGRYDMVKNLLIKMTNDESDQINNSFINDLAEVMKDIQTRGFIDFIKVILNLIGYSNDQYSQTFRCWMEDVTLSSAVHVLKNQPIDNSKEVENSSCILLDYFIRVFKFIQPNQIPVLWDLLDYNKILSDEMHLCHKLQNSNNEKQFSYVAQFVSEIRCLIESGCDDIALFTMMACSVQNQFTMPEVLGMVNNSSRFEQVKEQALRCKDPKLGNALLTHIQGVRKGWVYARLLMRSLQLSYKDHQDLQIYVYAQFANGIYKSQTEGKFDLFKIKELGQVKAEVCAILMSALFKDDRPTFHKLVSLYLADQIKCGDPITCPFFSIECHDLLTPHAKDYFRAHSIQVDSWPDIHNRDLEYLEEEFLGECPSNTNMLQFHDQVGPVTPGCLSLSSYFPDGVEIHFVDDAMILYDILSEAVSSGVVQIDSEWNPVNSDNENPDVQIVQLQTKSNLQILDHAKLKKDETQCGCLVELFESEFVEKVGFDLKNDISHMANDISAKWQSIRDLQPKPGQGLSKQVNNKLGKSLCKQYQVSHWGRRPLLQSQMHYAAMDSYVLYLVDN